jgi:chloride channel 7
MTLVEEYLLEKKSEYTILLLNEDTSIAYAYFYWVSFSLICALIAVILTVYVGPGAMGSGVPEVMGLLNGVNYPKAIDISTLVVKIIGVEFAVIGNLAIGKEGPLVHIGAIIGAMTPYIPFSIFESFRNDMDKRTFMAAGSSAGVSAAFGAPIGGALFSYEISKPNTFWTFGMLWRVFFSSAISTLTLGLLSEMKSGAPLTLNSSAVLKFGKISYFDTPMTDLLIAIILGTICGLLGAFFICVYAILGFFRKKFIDSKLKKVLEVVLFSMISASIFFWLSAACMDCNP